MPEYTLSGIQYPTASDLLKQESVAAKLASDMQALAFTADAAVKIEGSRAENAAKDAATVIATAQAAAVIGVADSAETKAGNAVATANDASASAGNTDGRVTALEAAAGFGPATPEDGTTANLLLAAGTLTNEALLGTIDQRLGIQTAAYGVVADGVTDDVMALTSAASAAATFGVPLVLPKDAVVALGDNFAFPAGVHAVANGTTLRGLSAAGGFLVNFNDDVTVEGHLKVEVAPGLNVRGAAFAASANVSIDALTVSAPSPGAGQDDLRDNAVQSNGATNIRVGVLNVVNFDRPVRFESTNQISIDVLLLQNYVTGLTLIGCSDVHVRRGRIWEKSPNASASPGHNGVLIQDSATSPSRRVQMDAVVVEDSGEHAFRVSGATDMGDFWFRSCVALRPGVCGFKAYAGTVANPRMQNINYIDCVVEDGGAVDSSYCAFLIQRVDGATIQNPVVRKRTKTNSTYLGFRITGCDGVDIIAPDVTDTASHAMVISVLVGPTVDVEVTRNVNVVGGQLRRYGGSALDIFYSSAATLGSINFSGTKIDTSGAATFSNSSTSGTHSEGVSTFDISINGQAVFNGGFFRVNTRIVGGFPTTPPSVRNGSTWQDTGTGDFKVRTGNAWRNL